ncbi:GCN5 family acetyltransferase [Gordonia sp. 852002-50816_SCH5313054-c]|uniref:GCN5 family acetyltransferase n=1 Tax=Gordonia jacobaea TaxID=122202 RepID=A0ABR5IGY9_9ACTN|nr:MULTISPECIES: GNAT family N-acetyltransferase [Gordonia]KNA93002.1 GCN5 family acetyltransferase [Gordonia jacobaea]OBC12841.1 GCN5 family acetyltransferase [Gordonia sp. 852002-50816_SCH5313054-a]OBC18836.1 GCN5 family acetyltransferase [Gordonia sp. 852002-50816_SCH5313054-c]
MLRLLGDKPLGARDAPVVARVLNADPVACCMVAARFETHGIDPRLLGGELWTADDPATSLCFSGANLIPLIGTSADMNYFAERALSSSRVCSSIVGDSDHVLAMWDRLCPAWGPAREVRPAQPLLALSGPPLVAPDPGVRLVTLDDLDVYLPAAVEMFIGEVGVDPCAGDGGRSYRRRLAALISAQRVFARFDGAAVVFKAEIGSLSRRVGQIQGVWVDPTRRGQGFGAGGTAAVAAAVQAQGRIPSLYVNSFNLPARSVYQRIGFTEVGTFATVLVD